VRPPARVPSVRPSGHAGQAIHSKRGACILRVGERGGVRGWLSDRMCCRSELPVRVVRRAAAGAHRAGRAHARLQRHRQRRPQRLCGATPAARRRRRDDRARPPTALAERPPTLRCGGSAGRGGRAAALALAQQERGHPGLRHHRRHIPPPITQRRLYSIAPPYNHYAISIARGLFLWLS
jgi:hypothetical protein